MIFKFNNCDKKIVGFGWRLRHFRGPVKLLELGFPKFDRIIKNRF
jgi:hypothetical protein